MPVTAGSSTDQNDTSRSPISGTSKSIEPPTSRQAMPRANSTPYAPTKTSATSRPMPARNRIRPSHENGRICNAIRPRIRHAAPATPGTSRPGFENSM
jgi:hypothetical protein